jgi:hypothetical protein
MFAYCGNNPVTRVDIGGYFWDTVFDVVSLVTSVIEVVNDPTDVGAWVGLALDVVDVVVPCFGGLGEIADAVNSARKVGEAADDIRDTKKVAETVSKSVRSSAVKKAWRNEVELVAATGKGTRNWTDLEIEELLTTGKVKGYEGHHMKSVKGYPDLAGDPLNIQFLTRKEHFAAHNGNWSNITHGRYVP